MHKLKFSVLISNSPYFSGELVELKLFKTKALRCMASIPIMMHNVFLLIFFRFDLRLCFCLLLKSSYFCLYFRFELSSSLLQLSLSSQSLLFDGDLSIAERHM